MSVQGSGFRRLYRALGLRVEGLGLELHLAADRRGAAAHGSGGHGRCHALNP